MNFLICFYWYDFFMFFNWMKIDNVNLLRSSCKKSLSFVSQRVQSHWIQYNLRSLRLGHGYNCIMFEELEFILCRGDATLTSKNVIPMLALVTHAKQTIFLFFYFIKAFAHSRIFLFLLYRRYGVLQTFKLTYSNTKTRRTFTCRSLFFWIILYAINTSNFKGLPSIKGVKVNNNSQTNASL